MNIITAVAAIIGAIVLAFVIALISAIPVWLLWNWLMPLLFGLKTVTFLQAWGLSFLSACLFKQTSTSSK